MPFTLLLAMVLSMSGLSAVNSFSTVSLSAIIFTQQDAGCLSGTPENIPPPLDNGTIPAACTDKLVRPNTTGHPAARAVSTPAPSEESPTRPQPDQKGASGPETKVDENDKPPTIPFDYSGDFTHRPVLTGDWDGIRTKLLQHGIRIDVLFMPILQGNLSGGLVQKPMFYGSLRYGIDVDTATAGLWRGGSCSFKIQTGCGRSANDQTGQGVINQVDWAAVDAGDGDPPTTVTDAILFQKLNGLFSVAGGRITSRDSNVFASDETTQFLNAAFNNNPAYNTTFPRQTLFASLLANPAPWFTLITAVLDAGPPAAEDRPGTDFNRGITLFTLTSFSVKTAELPGHHRLGGTWSNKVKPTLEGLISPDLYPDTVSSDWGLNYDFDQFLMQDRSSPNRGFGVFGRFGLGNPVTNKTSAFYSFGLGGRGMWPGRPADSFGVGYFYDTTSKRVPPEIRTLLRNERGFEAYYNLGLKPWLELTLDLQVVTPPLKEDAQAVVGGVRLLIRL
ncbi:MAG TPA: carbohydrate porin [Acidobacteriota bacterium]|nr:carbohydrate porin [Acidobacteriota bacterium]HNR39441.1 carbohydrate porin [Acidobacteriota bacterium]HNU00039.1 carbohydrate porin [Acidobacteriota bacterium]HPB71123.1 carbohydrate porin [Syntrophales bacterium]